jgi:hypothetical protein
MPADPTDQIARVLVRARLIIRSREHEVVGGMLDDRPWVDAIMDDALIAETRHRLWRARTNT